MPVVKTGGNFIDSDIIEKQFMQQVGIFNVLRKKWDISADWGDDIPEADRREGFKPAFSYNAVCVHLTQPIIHVTSTITHGSLSRSTSI